MAVSKHYTFQMVDTDADEGSTEYWRDYKKHARAERDERGKRNLAAANPDGWTQHTPYYWSREFKGKRLDYWPSRNKFQYAKGRVMHGDVDKWMEARMPQ